MPRSNTNWASKRRAEYIEDTLITQGYVNRASLTEYFGIEKSLGSMDITAYSKRAPLRKATAGEVMPDGTMVVGYKKGGSLLWLAGDGWSGVTGSTPERRKAWGLLPVASGGAREWFTAVMTAWAEDNPLDSVEDAIAYFGITKGEAHGLREVYSLNNPHPERAKIWEYFK